MNIPLSSPFIEQDDIDAVVTVLKTRWLSLGPKLEEFETAFAKRVGTKYAVAMNSGTSALHVAVKGLGIGPGDEVLVTPFSFVASANCVLYEGATPVFVDIDPRTFNIDPAKIEQRITPRTKAIVAVDVFGYPYDKEAIARIAKRHKLKIIEDTAEALGATFDGRQVGTFGACGIFAFYPNKQMTTGEGGVLVTDDEQLYRLARSLRNQGRGEDDEWHEYVRIGYNYRLSDINCALGTSQLKKIDRILAQREAVARMYTEQLKGVPGITTPAENTARERRSWFVYVVQAQQRERLQAKLKEQGIASSPYFSPIHLTRPYRELGHTEGEFPVCEAVAKTTLALPFWTGMSRDDVRQVCECVRKIQVER